MLYNILAIGDVVGGCGVSCLERHLRAVKKLKNIHFTVVKDHDRLNPQDLKLKLDAKTLLIAET